MFKHWLNKIRYGNIDNGKVVSLDYYDAIAWEPGYYTAVCHCANCQKKETAYVMIGQRNSVRSALSCPRCKVGKLQYSSLFNY